MNLPEKLTYLRKEKGLTQNALADALHVSRQAISRWEVGTAAPGIDNLKVLSDVYGVSVDYLLDDQTDLPNPCAEPVAPECSELPQPIRRTKSVTLPVWSVALTLAILIVLTTLCVWTILANRQEPEGPVPLSKIASEGEDGYPVYSFSFNSFSSVN